MQNIPQSSSEFTVVPPGRTTFGSSPAFPALVACVFKSSSKWFIHATCLVWEGWHLSKCSDRSMLSDLIIITQCHLWENTWVAALHSSILNFHFMCMVVTEQTGGVGAHNILLWKGYPLSLSGGPPTHTHLLGSKCPLPEERCLSMPETGEKERNYLFKSYTDLE